MDKQAVFRDMFAEASAKSRFRNLFTEIFQKNRLDAYINEENIEKFEQLTVLMLETNALMNITALTTPEKIIPLHYADCVAIAPYIPEGATVIDIGCGGGFPLLPLAIVRPDLHLVGVDSTEKKIRYVENTAKTLKLDVKTIAARAEGLGHDPAHREKYDVAISRAVARMNVLSELALPLVRVGGVFLAMKGAAGQEEMAEAAAGCVRLGGAPEPSSALAPSYSLYTLGETEARTLLQVPKTTPTPPEFPRSFGNMKKKPL